MTSYLNSRQRGWALAPFPFHRDEETKRETLVAFYNILKYITSKIARIPNNLKEEVELIREWLESEDKEQSIEEDSKIGKAIKEVLQWVSTLVEKILKPLIQAYNRAAGGQRQGPGQDTLSLGLRNSASGSFGLDDMHDRMRAIYRLSYVDKNGRGVFERSY